MVEHKAQTKIDVHASLAQLSHVRILVLCDRRACSAEQAERFRSIISEASTKMSGVLHFEFLQKESNAAWGQAQVTSQIFFLTKFSVGEEFLG